VLIGRVNRKSFHSRLGHDSQARRTGRVTVRWTETPLLFWLSSLPVLQALFCERQKLTWAVLTHSRTWMVASKKFNSKYGLT